MTKILATLAVAATLATGAVAIPTSQANAACFGCYVGAGIAAGLIGGALIAGATAPAYISGFEFATEFGRAIEREARRGASFLAIG